MPTTVPYVSAAAFTAHPTYLDLDDLRAGDNSSLDQTSELTNVLLMSSQWADNYSEQTQLGAHQVTQNGRLRVDRDGNFKPHPHTSPVLSVTSFSYGRTPASLTPLSPLTPWIEDEGRLVTIPACGTGSSWSGTFGPVRPGAYLYTQWLYVAGWVATTLAATAIAGATSLEVADPAGILPGAVYRIWEPGYEESVTVSAAYVSPALTVPPTPTSIPLAAATINPHQAGHDFSGMTSDLRLAIINYGISQLMRPDTAAEDSYPDTRNASGTRQQDSRQDGSGLVAEAERIIDKYRRIC